MRAICEFIARPETGAIPADPLRRLQRRCRTPTRSGCSPATTVPVPKLVFFDAWRAGGDGPGTTWDNRNGFAAADSEPDRRIDYVLVGYPRDVGVGHVTAATLVGDEPVGGVWPSDHFGVCADVRLEPVVNSI